MKALTIMMQRCGTRSTRESMLSLGRRDVVAAIETRPLAGAHAGRDKKLFVGQMTTDNNAKKTKMSRQRLRPSSPSGRPIHFREGLAETDQARQRLGGSCDLLSAYQSA